MLPANPLGSVPDSLPAWEWSTGDLLLSRPFPSLQPDQDLLVGPAGSGAERLQAARAADRSWAAIYSGHGRPLSVDLTRLASPTLRAWWYVREPEPLTTLAR